MQKIISDGAPLTVNEHIENILNKIEPEGFYHNLKPIIMKIPIFCIGVGSKKLEERFPLFFPNRIFYDAFILKSDIEKEFKIKHRFYLGYKSENINLEGYIKELNNLTKEVGKLLTQQDLEIFDGRVKSDKKPEAPYIMNHFNDGDYDLTEIRLKLETGKRFEDSTIERSLRTFYEFFKGLS